jgi:hypothetical protein
VTSPVEQLRADIEDRESLEVPLLDKAGGLNTFCSIKKNYCFIALMGNKVSK